MKKLVAVVSVLVAMAWAFFACSDIKPPISTEGSSQSTTEEVTSISWPTYAPADIKLTPNEFLFSKETWGCILKYRLVYYGIPSYVGELARNSGIQGPDIDALHLGSNGTYVESDEMDIVVWIKHFGIEKEDFVASMEKNKQWRLENWKEMSDLDAEGLEYPNPDIIYTFDNEIINAYYRRENPVEPDWTKVKTYESYAAYLAANPQ